MENNGIYIASKAHHGGKWLIMREALKLPIISTWIDLHRPGAISDWSAHWATCVREASECAALVIYVEPGEILKGALVEMGAAMASGKNVYGVGEFDGSYGNHPLFSPCRDLDEAFAAAVCHVTVPA